VRVEVEPVIRIKVCQPRDDEDWGSSIGLLPRIFNRSFLRFLIAWSQLSALLQRGLQERRVLMSDSNKVSVQAAIWFLSPRPDDFNKSHQAAEGPCEGARWRRYWGFPYTCLRPSSKPYLDCQRCTRGRCTRVARGRQINRGSEPGVLKPSCQAKSKPGLMSWPNSRNQDW
jgi:hypothetical protein